MSHWDEILGKIGVSSMRELFRRARDYGIDTVSMMNEYLRSEPLFQLIGLEFTEIGEGFVKARFPYKREILRRGGVVHGGVIMTVIDSILGVAVMTVNDGVDQYTAELKVHFLEPLRDGPFTVEGRVIRAGRHLAVAEAEVRDSNNKLCAKGIGTWFMVKENRH
ncbi:PaaI family thioesterase [Vulcanisaeta thermophila]|uniref:PaaI family thioesterase n=1 Tax=Vulcanisaeta thermophila TaxID=867917 RepID=UPI000A00A15E|nr:PaaI family thioesterase [Vulcanisaeta thermophila]